MVTELFNWFVGVTLAAQSYCFGTYFSVDGTVFTAAHVVSASEYRVPKKVAGKKTVISPKGYDIAAFGDVNIPLIPLEPGMRVTIRGYPAGATRVPEVRFGTVVDRFDSKQWYVKLDDGQQPVVSGMSGGSVTWRSHVVGVLVSTMSPLDSDSDGVYEYYAGITSLFDAFSN